MNTEYTPDLLAFADGETITDEERTRFKELVDGSYARLKLKSDYNESEENEYLEREHLTLAPPSVCKNPSKLYVLRVKDYTTDSFLESPGYIVIREQESPVLLLLASSLASLHQYTGAFFVSVYKYITYAWASLAREAKCATLSTTAIIVDTPLDDKLAYFLAALEVAVGAPGTTVEKQGLLESAQDPKLSIKYGFGDDENLTAVQRLRLAVGVLAFFGKSTDLERINKYRTNAAMPLARAMAIVAPPRPTPRKKTGFLGFLGRLFGW